jgi:ATP-dependent Clp protease ATP-binding subunit ClpA
VVMFTPLAKDEVRKITLQQIEKIKATLTKSGRTLAVTPEAVEQLVADGYSLAYGARFLKRVIESKVKMPISQHWAEGQSFVADVHDGHVAVDVIEARAGYPALAATA